MNINRNISKYNFNAGTTSRIKYIVIHWVGAVSTAKNNAIYFAGADRGSSAHYFVDENEIWQSVEDANQAWHCGSKTGYKHAECRNANSLGIEMCVKQDKNGVWYFEDKTVENTVWLTRYLMQKYCVPVENVIRHFDVTGKDCPYPYYKNNTKHTWDAFKKSLANFGEWLRAADGIRWWYRLNGDDKQYLKTTWANINGRRYLFNNEGYMCIGHTTWGGKSYFFSPANDDDMGKLMCTDSNDNYALGFVSVNDIFKVG